MPKGADNCPLPEFVVVHFRDYAGPPVFSNMPRTWVPIPAVEVRSEQKQIIVACELASSFSLGLDVPQMSRHHCARGHHHIIFWHQNASASQQARFGVRGLDSSNHMGTGCFSRLACVGGIPRSPADKGLQSPQRVRNAG